jgi:RecB family exonuclease
VITPRRTRLVRAADLAAFRTTLTTWIADLPPRRARDTFLLVPTRAAAEALRRTVEDRVLDERRTGIVWPIAGPRGDLYDELARRLVDRPMRVSAVEREVMVQAATRATREEPPFEMRPPLVAEMLALYDEVRRLGRTVDDFSRNLAGELERDEETDHGARRLLQQTRFLAEVYRGYEARLAASGACDEHTLRARLLDRPAGRPLARVIVSIADRLAEPHGFWPADLDLLARLPGLAELDLVATEAVLAAGFLERLHAALPDLTEESPAAPDRPPPILIVPHPRRDADEPPVAFDHRDREDELVAVARRLKCERARGDGAPLHRTALVVHRPLPYLYLARDVFADAGVPFEALDTLPLAAEPYAAALDLVLDAVASDFPRAALVALLGSPHFRLAPERAQEPGVAPDAIAACDAALAEARYLGGLDRLERLAAEWAAIDRPASREARLRRAALPALAAVLAAVRPLRPLADARPITAQLRSLLDWLRRHDRPPADGDDTRSRTLRVRAAVHGALGALGDAYRRHDPDAPGDVRALTAAIHRWLGGQTFAVLGGEAGLQIVDAGTARYGEFEDVQLVGLIDGEWPERSRRSVFYPASLLAVLEPLGAVPDPGRRDRESLQAARASFRDLVHLASARVRLSTFALEHDAIVEPSVLLDDVRALGLTMRRETPAAARVLVSEAVALAPRRADAVRPLSAPWAAARLAGDQPAIDRFRGEIGAWRLPRVSVSRLERYLDCPFRFFSSEVLQLVEQPEDEDTRTPLERGRFLHEIWERFFREWQRRGHGRIEPGLAEDARALFESIANEALAHLPPSEAALERTRLLGSAVSAGIAHRVIAAEAREPTPIVERLLEFPLQGEFLFRRRTGETGRVALSAQADRIDVLEGRALRVIDYKSRQTPDPKQALQLPIYSHAARETLALTRGGRWTIADAMYLTFEGERAVVPLRARSTALDELIDEAQDRLLATLDRIAGGHFPASPARRNLCGPCPYRSVCRLDIVERGVESAGE